MEDMQAMDIVNLVVCSLVAWAVLVALEYLGLLELAVVVFKIINTVIAVIALVRFVLLVVLFLVREYLRNNTPPAMAGTGAAIGRSAIATGH
jgi:hypothetical protein